MSRGTCDETLRATPDWTAREALHPVRRASRELLRRMASRLDLIVSCSSYTFPSSSVFRISTNQISPRVSACQERSRRSSALDCYVARDGFYRDWRAALTNASAEIRRAYLFQRHVGRLAFDLAVDAIDRQVCVKTVFEAQHHTTTDAVHAYAACAQTRDRYVQRPADAVHLCLAHRVIQSNFTAYAIEAHDAVDLAYAHVSRDGLKR